MIEDDQLIILDRLFRGPVKGWWIEICKCGHDLIIFLVRLVCFKNLYWQFVRIFASIWLWFRAIEWTDANVLALIELYRNRPILWNCQLEDYKNKNFRHDALLEIASHLGVEKGKAENKIKYLQTNLARELKKEKKSEGTGTGGAKMYKSKWYCFDALMFLHDTKCSHNKMCWMRLLNAKSWIRVDGDRWSSKAAQLKLIILVWTHLSKGIQPFLDSRTQYRTLIT